MKLEFIGVTNGYNYEDQKLSAISVDDELLLDCGTSALPRGLYKSLNGIILSHGHTDHISGLKQITLGLYVEKTNEGKKETDFRIYGPIGIGTRIQDSIEKRFRPFTSIRELAPFDFVDFNGYHITTYLVEHSDSVNSLAYKLEKDGKSIVYTGDTKYNPSPKYENVDVLIHEASFVDEYEKTANAWGHSTARQAAKVAKKVGAKKLVLSLISPHVRKDKFAELIMESEEEFGGEIIVAQEGKLVYV